MNLQFSFPFMTSASSAETTSSVAPAGVTASSPFSGIMALFSQPPSDATTANPGQPAANTSLSNNGQTQAQTTLAVLTPEISAQILTPTNTQPQDLSTLTPQPKAAPLAEVLFAGDPAAEPASDGAEIKFSNADVQLPVDAGVLPTTSPPAKPVPFQMVSPVAAAAAEVGVASKPPTDIDAPHTGPIFAAAKPEMVKNEPASAKSALALAQPSAGPQTQSNTAPAKPEPIVAMATTTPHQLATQTPNAVVVDPAEPQNSAPVEHARATPQLTPAVSTVQQSEANPTKTQLPPTPTPQAHPNSQSEAASNVAPGNDQTRPILMGNTVEPARTSIAAPAALTNRSVVQTPVMRDQGQVPAAPANVPAPQTQNIANVADQTANKGEAATPLAGPKPQPLPPAVTSIAPVLTLPQEPDVQAANGPPVTVQATVAAQLPPSVARTAGAEPAAPVKPKIKAEPTQTNAVLKTESAEEQQPVVIKSVVANDALTETKSQPVSARPEIGLPTAPDPQERRPLTLADLARVEQAQALNRSVPSPVSAAETQTKSTPNRPFSEALISQVKTVDVSEGRTTINLTPRGLGNIEVEVISDKDVTSKVIIRVENPMVLNSLREDRNMLAQAIGVSDSSVFEFHERAAGDQSNGTNQSSNGQNELDIAGPSQGSDQPAHTDLIANGQLDIMT